MREERSPFTMNAEEVKVGCFQMVLVLILGVNYVIVAMSHALLIFHNYTPKFYCQTEHSTNRSYGCLNAANLSIAISTSTTPEVSLLASCSGEYRFVTEFAESSVVTEWNLICERHHLSYLGPIIYYVGLLLGAWVAGFLIDRIGRLPVLAICLYAQGTMAVALYIAQNYPAFLILRGLQGVFVQGLQNSTYILSLELIPMRFRTLVALIMHIFSSIGIALLAVLSYVIPDWRILQLAVSVPTAITVLYIWIIPESPRWLLARGKLTEADMAFERIVKYNTCCIRSRKENISMQEADVKNNATPIKPQRRSRVTSVELKKARTDEYQQEERTNLLNGSETTGQEIIERASKDNPTNSESISSNVELRRDTSNTATDLDKRDLPSSSACDRRSKIISHSQCEQKIVPKNSEELVLRRVKKPKTNENEEKAEDDVKKQATNKISSIFNNPFESATLRRYGVIMIHQWCTSALMGSIFDDFVPDISSNRHVTIVLGGAIDAVTYIFVYFVVSMYGRRLPMCVYQLFNGAICILIATILLSIAATPPPWFDLLRMIISLFGRVTFTSAIFIAGFYTIETFPTERRGSCLGLCVMFAKICSIGYMISRTLFLGRYMSLPATFLSIGALGLMSGVLVLILPETSNRILPDRAIDIEIGDNSHKSDDVNMENGTKKEDALKRQILTERLFSENWVDFGNGILVNFTETKNTE